MKEFKGKAIYTPKGKAAEYARWACNFYVGCSNGCEYCYCKKGILASQMGGDKPTLKKCFKDENDAYNCFAEELLRNKEEIQKHGLFLSFTTDPMLEECASLTMWAAVTAILNDVPVKILTKTTHWVDEVIYRSELPNAGKDLYAFGFTLTGRDDLEPNASTNAERIEAMRKLHEAGFKTFASLEPIIDLDCTLNVYHESYPFCDLFKIGLMSGKKYRKKDLQTFICKILAKRMSDFDVNEYAVRRMLNINAEKAILTDKKIYFKDSLLKAACIDRSNLPNNCVDRDYNMFNVNKESE